MLTQLSLNSRTSNPGALQQQAVVFLQGRQRFNIGLIGRMLLPYPGLPLGVQLGDKRPVPMVSRIEHPGGNIQRLPQRCVRSGAHLSLNSAFA
jgi:hypothetical protein